jgi:hypothetical protein
LNSRGEGIKYTKTVKEFCLDIKQRKDNKAKLEIKQNIFFGAEVVLSVFFPPFFAFLKITVKMKKKLNLFRLCSGHWKLHQSFKHKEMLSQQSLKKKKKVWKLQTRKQENQVCKKKFFFKPFLEQQHFGKSVKKLGTDTFFVKRKFSGIKTSAKLRWEDEKNCAKMKTFGLQRQEFL